MPEMRVLRVLNLIFLPLLIEVAFALKNRDTLVRRSIYDETQLNGFHNNFRVCVHAPLSRDFDSQDADAFYENGRQQLLGYELWAQYVNYDKKGFKIGSEVWGVELVVIEDFSDDETVGENTEKCLNGEFGHMDWMFAAFTSALTQASLVQTVGVDCCWCYHLFL